MILIAAVAANRAIGRNNELLQRLPEDMKFFRSVTLNHTCVMGRKTYESIGRPLPHRQNIILTRQPHYTAEGCTVVRNIERVLELSPKVFIIGGEQIYRAFLPHADTLLLTHLDGSWEGDAFFPAWDEAQWKCISERRGTDCTFREYKRKMEFVYAR